MTFKTTTSLLLTATFLLLTGCGDDAQNTETIIEETISTVVVPPKENTNALKSLSLSISQTTLNKDDNTSVNLVATYADNSTKVPSTVEWIVSPKDSVDVNGTTLSVKKDGNVTVQAKVGTLLSNAITLNIAWIVDGYILPLEPDEVLNNSTLLGIDSNNNGVRDDVERWIYEEYKDNHPIHIDIAMQAARGYKLVLETPERAKEIYKQVDKAIDCQSYYKYSAKYYGDPILIKENAVNEYFRSKIYFNTEERMATYDQYDTLLSGDSYTLPKDKEKKAACDFNTSKYEE